MLQNLAIAVAQVKACNTSKSLPNKIFQIKYFLYQANEITKKVYNNILNSIQIQNKMNTIFKNSKNSKTSDPHSLVLNRANKIYLRSGDKYIALSSLSIYYT